MYHAGFVTSTAAFATRPTPDPAAPLERDYPARFFESHREDLSSARAAGQGARRLRIGDLVERIERSFGLARIRHPCNRGTHLGEAGGERMIGQLANALEDARFLFVREVGFLGPKNDADLERSREAQPDTRVHDEVPARGRSARTISSFRVRKTSKPASMSALFMREALWGRDSDIGGRARGSKNSEARPQAYFGAERSTP